MYFNLNKRLLLVLAVLLMLVLIPTAFASDVDDASAVGMNDQSAVEGFSIPATDDAVVESPSQSAVDDKVSASYGSDALEAYDETDFVAASDEAIYVDGFNEPGGNGTIDDPSHSLNNALVAENSGKEIKLLPGTYDFAGTRINLNNDFTLTAVGDVIFTTSSNALFTKSTVSTVTFNGIQFKDITSSNSAVIYSYNSDIGTLNFINCSFINNTASNLIRSSCNVNVKGCIFTDNEATGTNRNIGGLINNYNAATNVINVSYSVFLNNKISFSNNTYHPLIVDWDNGGGPAVIFNYNYLNDNNEATDAEIAYNDVEVTKDDYAILTAIEPNVMPSGTTADLVVNFTKSDGSALDDFMPDITVDLVPTKIISLIPVSITNNSGKGQYTAKNDVYYTECINVKYDGHVLSTFMFDIEGSHALLDPELTVPESLTVYEGLAVDVDASHEGDGNITCEIKSGGDHIAIEGNTITGISPGTAVVTVRISDTDVYYSDSFDVTVTVKASPVYVDGFDGVGGSGTIDNPYHSLVNAIVGEYNGREIRLLSGTYDFNSTINIAAELFTLTAFEDDVIFTTSKDNMFKINSGPCNVTFNGISFKDSTVGGSVVTHTSTSHIATLNFNNCSFINNHGENLIHSSCNVNIKGCIFADNEATGEGKNNGGLINNYYAHENTINISYSIFVNNRISYDNNGFNPIIVDWDNDVGPSVVFNYNFVKGNITDEEIAYNSRITKGDLTIITVTAPDNISAGDIIDLEVNFTKSDGSALDDYMPDINVTLVPSKVFASIPVSISNNGGKGQYATRDEISYTERGDVVYDGYSLSNFTFNVVGSHALLDPELTVPESLNVNFGFTVDINATYVGDGAISYEIKYGSEYISLEGNTIKGVKLGTAAVTVRVSETATYDSDSFDVTVIVCPGPFFVDGFDGVGGNGTLDDPCHSLKSALTDSSLKFNDIYLLPGIYDFGNTRISFSEKDFTLTAIDDVVFTSSETLFYTHYEKILTFNGIQFKDISSSSSWILYTGSSIQGTLNLNNCSIINNIGSNLVSSSFNINIKGCTFINNEACPLYSDGGGIIENIWGSPVINISYSIFINNNIHLSYMGTNPIVFNDMGSPSVYFDYNFVNNNNPLNEDEIVSECQLISYSPVNIAVTPLSVVSAGDTVELDLNFTKIDGNVLDEYMPDLNVSLVPRVNVGSNSVSIIDNCGKSEYTAESKSYTETIDIKYDDYVLNTFEFYVSEDGLLDPELNVPSSLIVDIGASVDINATHVGDGAISYLVANESVVTVDENGVVTGVGEGITTITVDVASADTYGEDSKQVTLMVKDPADGDAIYVDGFDGVGGSGIKVDPYHSLEDTLVDANSGKEIRIMPGIYDFITSIDLHSNSFVLNAVDDGVIFTSSSVSMFMVTLPNVTFNGIKFKDSNVDSALITYTTYTLQGTFNFNNCDFINNSAECLIKTAFNLNFKGCTFINNKALNIDEYFGGLINDHYGKGDVINISYCVFIGNEIAFSAYGYNPIIVGLKTTFGEVSNVFPNVIFNYNFVNDNYDKFDSEIAYHVSSLTREDYSIIAPTSPSDVFAGDTVDLMVNFTKSDGSPLEDCMPNLTVQLVPTVVSNPIPVTINNNSGKGQYNAKIGHYYTENVDVEVYDNELTSFEFYVDGSNRYYTSIASDDLVMNYKDGSVWAITLTDENGDAISNAPVKIGVAGKVYNRVTDADGVASLPINLNPGTYEIYAKFDETDWYSSAFANATVTVNKAVPALAADDLVMSYKDGSGWNVALAGIGGVAIPNVIVNIGIVGKVYAIKTNDEGIAVLPINLASGTYEINATFDGNKYYSNASVNAIVTVNKAVPVLTAEDLVMSYKDGSVYSVTLTDASGNAITNTYVKVIIGSSTYSRKTDANGVATLPINLPIGQYNVTAKFDGDSKYDAFEISNAITVNKPVMSIAAEDVNMTYKDGTSYAVQLINSEGNPVAIANEIIKITINGKTYDRKTNSEGIATLPINLMAGTYTITAEYGENTISSTIIVNKA